MTVDLSHARLLASVTTEVEARVAAGAGAHIIDAKNPAAGALGALPLAVVRAIRAAVPCDTPVSATIGDLVADAQLVTLAAEAMAKTGVNYVKVGFFGAGDHARVVAALGALRADARRWPEANPGLIGVLLADEAPDLSLIEAMADAGFSGVLMDTANKTGRSLIDHMPLQDLDAFVRRAKRARLMVGLAGSLRVSHIPLLMRLRPDILGFRGALCRAGEREAALDPLAVRAVSRAFSEALLALRDVPGDEQADTILERCS